MSKCKYKSWTTKRILEVLNENYNRGTSGKDYGPIVSYLEQELWHRQQVESEKKLNRDIKTYNNQTRTNYELSEDEILDALIGG